MSGASLSSASPSDAEIRADVESGWPGLQKWSAEMGPCKLHTQRQVTSLVGQLDPTSVLEIGCGDGVNLCFLERLFPRSELFGVDKNPRQIERIRRALPQVQVEVLDATLGSSSRNHDLVATFDVLEHVEDDLAFLGNTFHMTRPGGHFVTQVLQGEMRSYEHRLGHVRCYAPGELTEKCAQVGFEIIEARSWGFPFFSPLYRSALEYRQVHLGTLGEPSLLAKIFARLLYALYFTNSSSTGDYLFLLARRPL